MKFEILNLKTFKKKILFSAYPKKVFLAKKNGFSILNEDTIPIILNLEFFFNLIKNYFLIYKDLKYKKSLFYITSLEIIKPSIVITFRTFHKIFIDIDKTNKFNCLTIQNTVLPLYNEKVFGVKYKDIFCSNIIFFGKYHAEHLLKKIKIKNYWINGALNVSRYLNKRKKKFKKYDICLTSVFRPEMSKLNESWIIFLKELSKLISKKNYKIAVCSRYIEKSRLKDKINQEKIFFEQHLKKFDFIKRSEFSTYKTIDSSILTISSYNTTLFESIALGKKTLFFDFKKNKFNHPGFKNFNGIKLFENNPKTLINNIKNIVKISQSEYSKRIFKLKEKICSTDRKLYQKLFKKNFLENLLRKSELGLKFPHDIRLKSLDKLKQQGKVI